MADPPPPQHLEAPNMLLTTVAPALGTLIAWLLFTSPLMAVIRASKARVLGSLNPLPFVAMWANCVGWLVYSFITHDYYVMASNLPGLILATFMTITCHGLADDKTRDTLLKGVMFFTVLLALGGVAISFGGMTHAAVVTTWGTITVFILLIFYGAPLSVFAEVLRSRSSAALYLPFAVMNMINGMLWSAYGLAVADPFIWAPNMVGTLFGGLQVVLCWVFPSLPTAPRPDKDPAEGETTEPLAGMLSDRELREDAYV